MNKLLIINGWRSNWIHLGSFIMLNKWIIQVDMNPENMSSGKKDSKKHLRYFLESSWPSMNSAIRYSFNRVSIPLYLLSVDARIGFKCVNWQRTYLKRCRWMRWHSMHQKFLIITQHSHYQSFKIMNLRRWESLLLTGRQHIRFYRMKWKCWLRNTKIRRSS